jgi:hypothetical protein
VGKFTREVLPDDEQTETIVEIRGELTVRGLNQGFVVEGAIGKKSFSIDSLAAKTRHAVIEGVPKNILWRLFQRVQVQVKEVSPEYAQYEGEILVAEPVASELEAQAKIGNEATANWQKAIKIIDQNLESLQYDRRELNDALMSFETFNSAADLGDNYARAISKYLPHYNKKRKHLGLKLKTPMQVVRSY